MAHRRGRRGWRASPRPKRDCRMAAVSGDRHARGDCRFAAIAADNGADNRAANGHRVGWTFRDRAAHVDARIELTTGGDRVLQQQPIEVTPGDGAARQPRRITPFDRHAAFSCDLHAVDAKAALVNPAGKIERLQTRHGTGVDRVAAQLVAREGGAVDDPDADAGAREDSPGHRAGRPAADNQDVKHWVIASSDH